ncbi:MAG: AGE family epimerase/isomerase [Nocardioides sp.]|uniref:AGE family epimerase/isomerase n=1 Tax=Nocardioides sp. TaxID=35761 RepID=UPI0039E2BF4F
MKHANQDGPTLAWLRRHRADLRRFAAASAAPGGGFGWLDDAGDRREDRDVELWITCRMTHVFALGVLEGDSGCAPLLDHGVQALRGRLHDDVHGGWYSAVGTHGPTATAKEGYGHAFVLLAASSALTAGHPDARSLLDDALSVHDERFWRTADDLVVDVWNRDWSALENYRGINANMHTVEALLAVGDVTTDAIWLQRAHRILTRVVEEFAAPHGYRMPEHFAADWTARLDYNRGDPAHPFRPFGVTIGHLLEWARLAVHVQTAVGSDASPRLLDHARSMFDVAVCDGWGVDGTAGFVYTTDFDGRAVVRDRLHWVVTEAIATAWSLHEATGDQQYLDWYGQWWDYACEYLLDGTGSWRHELDPENRPAATVWQGKPDVYHAYQASLLPELNRPISFAGGAYDLAQRRRATASSSPATSPMGEG